MPSYADQPITILLQEVATGDKQAIDRLIPLVYPELQRLARGYLRNERPGHTLQPTALVNEAYARLAKQEQPDYRSRAHFVGVAAHGLPHLPVDPGRSPHDPKRGWRRP